MNPQHSNPQREKLSPQRGSGDAASLWVAVLRDLLRPEAGWLLWPVGWEAL